MQSETRPQIARPKRIRLEEDGQRTTLSWRVWTPGSMVLMAVICAFWDGATVLMYSRMDAFDLLVCIPAAGFITYVTLMGSLNTTRLEVSRGELRMRHGPLPFWNIPRELTLSGSDITQLHGEEKRGSKGKITYSLFALDKQGRKTELAFWLEHKDEVLYLEQTLERLLGLEDRPVEGEAATRSKVA